ncbi:type-1 angiotensin II receptor-like [Hydra vulgaris]|uniref:Type-1 angiotensin II receptor-like n=1 Tax=Hydra vulgaris TaxID=6087 RepID=A0ABM4CRA0_HYDVU
MTKFFQNAEATHERLSKLGNLTLMCNNSALLSGKKKLTLTYSMKVILGFDVLIIVVALLLHIVGLSVLLSLRQKKLSPQKIFIVHLSFVSIINIISTTTVVHSEYQGYKIYDNTLILAFNCAHMAYINNLCLLTLDRFMFIAFPFRYRARITKCIIFCSLGVLWLISIISGISMTFSKNSNFTVVWFCSTAFFIYTGFVIGLTICVYGFIVVRTYYSSLINGNQILKKKKLFIIPFLIIFTFFLFAFLPHLIYYYATVNSNNTGKNWLVILIGINTLNNVSDPIIYIYLQATAMAQFLMLIRKLMASMSIVSRKMCFFSPAYFYYQRKRKVASFTSNSDFDLDFQNIESVERFGNELAVLQNSN